MSSELRVASIDVGTNSVLLTIARCPSQGSEGGGGEEGEKKEEAEPEPEPLGEWCEIPRLGEGLQRSGRLDPDAIERTLRVLLGYRRRIERHGVARWAAVGTAALRTAANADAFLEPAERCLGCPVEVVTGEREAQLAARGALSGWPRPRPSQALIVDIGGGSTEFVWWRGGRVEQARSLPLGVVRLTEAFLRDDPPSPRQCRHLQEHVAGALRDLPEPTRPVVAVAGTATTLAMLAQGLERYEAARVHGTWLPFEALSGWAHRLAAMPLPRRRALPGVPARRADVLVAGALLLQAVVSWSGAPGCWISDRGVRWGRLLELCALAGT